MNDALERIGEAAVEAARGALPEFVTIGAATVLPRGADPFIGTDRPLLLSATRWAVVSPGGVLIGGSPAGVAAVLGFDVPERPAPVAPEDRKPGDAPPPRWADLVTEAARAPVTTFSHAVADAVSRLSGLPPECAATQLSMNDSDAEVRGEVGPLPDAIVLMLHAEEHDVRLVVVVPGIFAARIGRPAAEAEVTQVEGETLARPTAPDVAPSAHRASAALDRTLAQVPLDLSINMGSARVPLSHVLELRDGAVLELRDAVDAPVNLVSGRTPVARGDLEVSEAGTLVLNVTSIPGRPGIAKPPRVMVDRRESDAEPAAAATPGADSEPGVVTPEPDVAEPGPDADASGVPPDPDAAADATEPIEEAAQDAPAAPPAEVSDDAQGDADEQEPS